MVVALAAGAAGLGILTGPPAPAAEVAEVAWRHPVQAVFGGRPVDLPVELRSPAAFQGRLFWRLTAGGRVLASQSQAVSAAKPGAQLVVIKMELPPVRAEVGLAVTAEAWLEAEGTGRHAIAQGKLWVLGDNPFPALQLPELPLWDLDNRLTPGLEQAGVKCRAWLPDAAGAPDTLILVGPGISPEAQAGEVDRLLRTVVAGGTVIWVSPGAGRLPLPQGGDGKPLLPSRLWFQSTAVMAELDKRLGVAWSGALPIELAPVEFPAALCDVRDRPAAADPAAPALVWLEARWPGGGRLILCTLPLAEAWNAGPAARYLLAAMLQPAPAAPRPETNPN
ncbi:MAG: DUF4350 domain-containing protein [Lentisphaeria bacterium]